MSKETEAVVSAISHDDDVAMSSVSSSPQSFIFRQLTFREIVTPSKQGNVSMKEVSFSMYSGDKWTSLSSQQRRGFSFSLNKLLQRGQENNMIMAPEKTSCQSATSAATTQSKRENSEVGKSHYMRSRSKNVPPTKRVKVDSIVDHKVPVEKRHMEKRTSHRQKLHWKYICIISLIPVIILFGIRFYVFRNESAQYSWNVYEVRKVLNQEVFGQREAISSLLYILKNTISKDLEKNKEMPVILITGPSGVGKSHTSSILASNFPPPGISDLVLSPLPPPKHIIHKCSESGHNFIVLDSLCPYSVNDSIEWVKHFLNEALWQNKPVIVVLIFNIQVLNDDFALGADDVTQDSLEAKGRAVHSDLKKHGLKPFHIHFKSLSEEDLENCIRVALRKRGLQENLITEKQINIIKSSIDYRHEGCKRVWSRTASAVSD